MSHDRNEDEWSPQGPVTELSDAESWLLLDSSAFGHLGLSVDDRPDIFPINYVCLDRRIVFRTAAGAKLSTLLHNRFAVFEADDRSDTGAWSVVVKGIAMVLDSPDEIRDADLAEWPTWVPTAPYVYVKIEPENVRGRRFLRHLRTERA
jgi:hypothetical protein